MEQSGNSGSIPTAVAYTYHKTEQVNQITSINGISSSLLAIAQPALIFTAGKTQYAVFEDGRIAVFIG